MKQLIDKKIIIALLILPFFEPDGINEMATYVGGIWFYLDVLFKVLKCISFFIIAFLAIYELKKPTTIFLIVAVYEIGIILASLINQNITVSLVVVAATVLGACILTDFYMQRCSRINFIKTIIVILGIFIIINFFSMLLYPEGIYINARGWSNNYFLGYKNSAIYVYLLFMLVVGISCHIKKKKLDIKYYLICLFILFLTIMSRSTTAIITMSMLVIAIVVFQHKKIPKIINVGSMYLTSVIISICIIAFHVQDQFNEIFELLFQKNSTFTGRTMIWNAGMIKILEHPLCGNGNISFDNITSAWVVTQIHNQFMDVMLMGGIILFFIFTLIFFVVSKRILLIKNTSLYNILLFIFCAYFTVFLTEALRSSISALMFIGLTITYNLIDVVGEDEYNSSTTIKKHHFKPIVIRWR